VIKKIVQGLSINTDNHRIFPYFNLDGYIVWVKKAYVQDLLGCVACDDTLQETE
jgi:hypothetical protein